MTEDRDEVLREYQQSRERLLSAIDGLSDEQMMERSLDGWSVTDHLNHLALWDEMRAADMERISAGHEPAWRMSEEQVAALNALAYEMRRSLSAGQARWELEMSRRRVLEAIRAATERGLDGSRYGAAGLRSDHEAEHAEWIERWRREKAY